VKRICLTLQIIHEKACQLFSYLVVIISKRKRKNKRIGNLFYKKTKYIEVTQVISHDILWGDLRFGVAGVFAATETNSKR
jgi:hypothetical protein